MILEIKNITKSFVQNGNKLEVHKDLSFSVNEGEFLCILGTSGCGKSTLLKEIAGFEKTESGSITLRGNEVLKPVETLVSIAHPLPGIALLPLIILWFGAGEISIIFIIVHSVVWPLVLNLLAGFKAIPKIYKQVGNNYGLNSLKIIRYIMLPASLPYFLTGMRISWARAWRALISAEMIFGAAGGKGGLGWFIFKNRVFMDTTGIFAGLIIIVVIGMLVEDLIFEKLEKVTIKKWGMTI